MKILFAAPENAWGGILDRLRTELPDHRFEATGGFHYFHARYCQSGG